MGEIEKLHSKIIQERLTSRLKAIKLGKDIINREANALFVPSKRVKQRTEDARKDQSHYAKMLKASSTKRLKQYHMIRLRFNSREEEEIAKVCRNFTV